ncbi:MAG: hypothetical protein AAGA58_01350 [Verrucomicrobiota bacterium]
MAVIVSDTTPLNHLILMDSVELLPRIFEEVVIPDLVQNELMAAGAPEKVRNWAVQLPDWTSVRATFDLVRLASPFSESLGAGERSAIALALDGGLPILMDDSRAKREAEQLGLDVVGTLAVLREAALRNWIDFRNAAKELVNAGFYISDEVIEGLAEELEERE